MRTTLGLLGLLTPLLAFSTPAQAQAQLMQPRCGGWPPGQGKPGLVLIAPGERCYGQIFRRVNPRVALTDVQVRRQAVQGQFRLVGLREFEFTPRADFRGWDRVGLDIVLDRGGRTVQRRMRMVVTTEEAFRQAGGTASSFPPGFGEGRWRGGDGDGFEENAYGGGGGFGGQGFAGGGRGMGRGR
jgi:hypothetical protein